MTTQPLTPAAARVARDVADQQLALAHEVKSRAAEKLAKLQAEPSTHPGAVAVAVEELSRAKTLYADAQAAADQAAKVERETVARKGGRR